MSSLDDPQQAPPERRDRQRFRVQCTALVRLSPTLTFRVQLRNLSLRAAQVVCEPCYALLVQIDPAAVRAKPQPLEISIALPGAGTTLGFTTACRALYREQLSEQQMLLGLSFEPSLRSSQQVLSEYLAALPNEATLLHPALNR